MTNLTYPVSVAGVERNLRLFEVAPGVKIAILNILGDTEFVQAVAKALAAKLIPVGADILVTPETKSIPLAHALSVEMGIPYVVLRKNHKPYMGDALRADTQSITTGQTQTLFLDEKDRALVAARNVILVDDVISTGSTLQGMRAIMHTAGAHIIAETAIFTEGDSAKWANIIALGHLPVFVDDVD
ncbi:MAG: phosphoribosyltransferase family protein [bacterium]|nr:phosphoribosyltransferase family protein [bacterium]